MAIIRSNQNGELVQVLRDHEIGLYPAPEDVVCELEFDEEMNSDILDGISQNINNYRMTEGTLTLDRTAVTVNPPTTERQRLVAARNANLDAPLATGDYSGESALIQALAEKIAWLEQEIQVLHTQLNLT